MKILTENKQTILRPPANALRVEQNRERYIMTAPTTETRKRQERRIRWTHGLSASHAALIAALVYGEQSV